MKAKRFYQTPAIEKAVVELEGGFCASVDIAKGATVGVYGQEVTDIDSDDPLVSGFNDSNWE